MTDALPEPPELDPAALAASEFTRTRRGLEPTEVRAALGRAADALRTWKVRDERHRAALEELRAELEASKELDESRIVSVLGEETARIVSAARDAATEIRTKAEEQAARLLAETDAQATAAAEALTTEATRLRDEAAALHDQAVADAARLRAEAEADAEQRLADARARSDELLEQAGSVLAERTAEAEEHAATLRASATEALEEAHATAGALRAAAEADAARIVEEARETGRRMIAEVRAARERMLGDLAERRRAARRQIEAALAGRDRIVDVLNEAGQRVAATIGSLEHVDEDANAAAEAAASTVGDDDELEELRAALEAGDPVDEALAGGAPPATRPGAWPTAAADAGSGSPVAPEAGPEPDTAPEPDAGSEAVADLEAAPEPAAGGAADGDATPVSELGAGAADARDDEDREDGAGPQDVGADDEAERGAAGGDGAADAGDEGPGATVHDLFERIRAEGLEGAEPEPAAPDGELAPDVAEGGTEAGAGADGDVEGDDAEIDLTDAAAAADGARSDADLLDRRDALLAPVEKQVSRILKRLVSDQQNEVLDRLRRHKRGRPDPEELLPAADEDAVAAWADALSEEFGRSVEAGASFWAEVAGSSTSALFDDDGATGVLRERLAGVLVLHRAHFERVLADSEERGEDTGELGSALSAAYRDWRSTVLPDVAGDLVTAGFAHGERRAAGPGTPWRWLVDNGGLPCADGEDNALGGAIPCEEPFPTGDLTPPAHPGCRCLLAPADR